MPHNRDQPHNGTAHHILDLYAGAGGWDVGAAILGLPAIGLEIEHDPCVTAVQAGHPRIRCDVATYPTAPFAGKAKRVLGSPPCQPWSRAGNRRGEADRGRVHDLVNRFAAGDPTAEHAWREPEWADSRSHHAAQPVRWIRDLRPEWVALEQVPEVLPLWKHIGDVLRGWGYSVVTQVLCAADYGVPQTRERAILIASRVRVAVMPETTHEKDPQPGVLFGAREPWVSMADAIGWSGAFRHFRGSASRIAEHGSRRDRETDEPAPTITGEAYRWTLLNGSQAKATTRTMSEPAATIHCSRPGNLRWAFDRPATTVRDSLSVTVTEAAALQSFPADYPWHGNKTSQFLQVGNAIPPRLAAAVIGAVAGIDWRVAVDAFYADRAAA